MLKKREGSGFIRKNPTQKRATDTIQTIFEATAQILQHDEKDKLSTNRIAEKAGFSVGTLYQYFPNKHAILLAMAHHERDRINNRIRAALEGADALPLEEVIRRIVRVVMHAFGGRHRMRKKMILGVIKHFDIGIFVASQNDIVDFIIAEIQRVSRSDIRVPNETMAYVMSRSLVGVIRGAIIEESPILNHADFENELVTLIKNYIEVRP